MLNNFKYKEQNCELVCGFTIATGLIDSKLLMQGTSESDTIKKFTKKLLECLGEYLELVLLNATASSIIENTNEQSKYDTPDGQLKVNTTNAVNSNTDIDAINSEFNDSTRNCGRVRHVTSLKWPRDINLFDLMVEYIRTISEINCQPMVNDLILRPNDQIIKHIMLIVSNKQAVANKIKRKKAKNKKKNMAKKNKSKLTFTEDEKLHKDNSFSGQGVGEQNSEAPLEDPNNVEDCSDKHSIGSKIATKLMDEDYVETLFDEICKCIFNSFDPTIYKLEADLLSDLKNVQDSIIDKIIKTEAQKYL